MIIKVTLQLPDFKITRKTLKIWRVYGRYYFPFKVNSVQKVSEAYWASVLIVGQGNLLKPQTSGKNLHGQLSKCAKFVETDLFISCLYIDEQIFK